MTLKKRFVFDAAVSTGLFFLTAVRRGLFSTGGMHDIFGILSDCFIIPGIILFGCGLLSFAADNGVFDMLTYSAYSLFKPHEYGNFYEYKCCRREKRTRYKDTLILGLAFLIISALFLSAYFIIK